jgi:hypothetical protein
MPPKKKSVRRKSGTKSVPRSNKLPAKKKSESKNPPVKRESGSNKSTVEKKAVNRADRLEETITEYAEKGRVRPAGPTGTDQLKSSKQFNWEWFRLWLIVVMFLLGIPLILYIFYYLTKPQGNNDILIERP